MRGSLLTTRVIYQYWRQHWNFKRGEGFFLFEFMKCSFGDSLTMSAHPATGMIVREGGAWQPYLTAMEFHDSTITTSKTPGSEFLPVGEPLPRRCAAKRRLLAELSSRRSR